MPSHFLVSLQTTAADEDIVFMVPFDPPRFESEAVVEVLAGGRTHETGGDNGFGFGRSFRSTRSPATLILPMSP